MRSNKEIFEAVLRRYENPTGEEVLGRYENPTGEFFGICSLVYDELAKDGFSTFSAVQKRKHDVMRVAYEFYVKMYGHEPEIAYWWSFKTFEENVQARREFLRKLLDEVYSS